MMKFLIDLNKLIKNYMKFNLCSKITFDFLYYLILKNFILLFLNQYNHYNKYLQILDDFIYKIIISYPQNNNIENL